MNAKRFFALLLSALMVFTCFAGMITVSADEAAEDKFAPTNEEPISMYLGAQAGALGSYGKGGTFGARFTVEEGKRLTQINFHALATYSTNVNYIVFKVYQWDTDYKTTVAGNVLAQATKINHTDNAPCDVVFPTNRNLTGDLLFVATYVDGEASMTPWMCDGGAFEGVSYFANGSTANPFCFGITVADALTVTPASYTATFMCEGAEVAKVTFLEGDTELYNIPEVPAKEGFYADWEEYTLANADITINAVYTDASDAIKPEISDAACMNGFAAEHKTYFRQTGSTCEVNRDGSVTFTGNWSIDGDVDATATLMYLQMMQSHYEGFTSKKDLPNKSHKYSVIALKVKAPEVSLESDVNMTVTVGRNTEVYCDEVANAIKCDGSEEYWIFDFSEEAKDFQSDVINSIAVNWAYSIGEESNLNAQFTILGFQFFDSLEDALNATGGEEATEPPTEAPTEAPTDDATEAPTEGADGSQQTPDESGNTGDTTEEGCASVVGFGAVAVLAAAAAVVALKKKD